MRKSIDVANDKAQKFAAWKALTALEAPTPEQVTEAEGLMETIKSLDAEYRRSQETEAFAVAQEESIKALSKPLTQVPTPSPSGNETLAAASKGLPVSSAFVVPGGMVTSVKNFSNFGKQVAEEQAYRFGQWFLSSVVAPSIPDGMSRFAKSVQWVKDNTNWVKAQNEISNTDGGILVPPEFDRAIIDLRERFGMFRKYTKVVPMMSDTKMVPRRISGLTPYFVTDNVAATESQKGWDSVNLIAKKLIVLAKFSSEVMEDAIINFGDDLAGEIAYAFSLKEDQCGFVGDGSSTYSGIVGVTNALLGLSATRADIAGLKVGTGNAWSELTLDDFLAVVGLLPEYADGPNCKWFCHKTFFHTVMQRLELAAGGVTATDIANGVGPRFLGYDVVFSQVFPKVQANDHVPAILGDLAMGSRFGDRRSNTIALDSSLGFANDQWAIRGTERFDINVHDVGNATSVAADKQPGPIVGILTAAS